jgi:hypothetical protein
MSRETRYLTVGFKCPYLPWNLEILNVLGWIMRGENCPMRT